MAVFILKLSNDEELLAEFEHALTKDTDEYLAINPMSIIGMRDDTYGSSGMRLRNAMVMSDSDHIIIRGRFVMAWYEPSAAMLAYYNAAVAYNKNFSKQAVDSQIIAAAADLQEQADLAGSIPDRTGARADAEGGNQSLDEMMESFNKLLNPNTGPGKRKLQ